MQSNSHLTHDCTEEKSIESLSAETIATYLQSNPDFFRLYPDLLAQMSLPHQSGSAVSLVERQVAILRERGIQTRQKLGQLIEHAKENDTLLQQTQQLVLKLLEANSLNNTFKLLEQALKNDFAVQTVSLLIFRQDDTQNSVDIDEQYQASLNQIADSIKDLIAEKNSTCGILRPAEIDCLFPHSDQSLIGSTAIAFRELKPKVTLMLAIAHSDADHYNSNTGTLFLDYLADVLNRISNRHLV